MWFVSLTCGQYESLKSYILRCALLSEVVLRASWVQNRCGRKGCAVGQVYFLLVIMMVVLLVTSMCHTLYVFLVLFHLNFKSVL